MFFTIDSDRGVVRYVVGGAAFELALLSPVGDAIEDWPAYAQLGNRQVLRRDGIPAWTAEEERFLTWELIDPNNPSGHANWRSLGPGIRPPGDALRRDPTEPDRR